MTRPTLLVASHTLRHRSGRARERLGTVPGSLLDVSRPLLASPGRPKIALEPVLARPSRVPNAPRRVPEPGLDAQNRPRSIFQRFFIDLARFFGDFRSTFGRFSLYFHTSLVLRPLLSSAPFLRCCAARVCRNNMQNANDKVKRAGFSSVHRWAARACPHDSHDRPITYEPTLYTFDQAVHT